MKNRTDRVLLAVSFLSLAAYIAILHTFLEGTGISRLSYLGEQLHTYLVIGFHAVPAFCLQLLLCRTVRRWVAALPLIFVCAASLLCGLGVLTAAGWDALGWGILLAGCAAPAAGCLLAWAVYGFSPLYQGGDSRG